MFNFIVLCLIISYIVLKTFFKQVCRINYLTFIHFLYILFFISVIMYNPWWVFFSSDILYIISKRTSDSFSERNLCTTEKLLHQGFRYHTLVKTFTKFYHRYKEIIRKYNSTCKHLIQSGILYPIFYVSILYKSQKCQYSPQKITKPLNRLIKKGYSYDSVVRSLKIAYFGFNIDSLIGPLHRN